MQKTSIKLNNLLAILVVFALLAFSVLSPVNALASNRGAVGDHKYVLDYYGVITDSDTYAKMEDQAAKATDASNIGVYLIYTDEVEGDSVRDYAIDLYKELDLGVGKDKSGVLLLIAVEDRKMVTITSGNGVNSFSDSRIEDMESAEKSYLSDNNFLEAGQKYLDLAQETVTPLTTADKLKGALPVGLVLAVIVFFITRKILKGQLKSVDTGHDANNYLTGEVKLTGKDTNFVGTTVTRVHHSRDNGGGSSSGGFGGSKGSSF